MSRWGKLIALMRIGAVLMLVGNGLLCTLQFVDSQWKYFAYLLPASIGQGIIYPSILFTSLASFDHHGMYMSTDTPRFHVAKTFLDHAVSTSTVYLLRSLGGVWGVSITSANFQTVLGSRLSEALGEIPHKWRVRPFCRVHCIGI